MRSMSVTVSILRLKKPNIQGEERVQKVQPKKKKKGIPIALAQVGLAGGGRGFCAAVFPRVEVNQIGNQKAWGSPLALSLADAWLYGLHHARGSTAVDLATGPL